jgi:hypothetical protein
MAIFHSFIQQQSYKQNSYPKNKKKILATNNDLATNHIPYNQNKTSIKINLITNNQPSTKIKPSPNVSHSTKDSHCQYRMDHSGSSNRCFYQDINHLICGVIDNILRCDIGLL